MWRWLMIRVGGALALLMLALSGGGLALGVLIPEGAQVAFMRDVAQPSSSSRSNWDIFLLDIRTGLIKSVTDDPTNERFPSWSPDGERIIYHADPQQYWRFDLFTINPDGTDRRMLGPFGDRPEYILNRTVDGTTIQMVPRTNSYSEPDYDEAIATWSPDGKWLAFHSGVRNLTPYLIYIYNLETGETFRLLDGPGEIVFPAWSPDGSRLVFAASTDPYTMTQPSGALQIREPLALYVMDVSGDLRDEAANADRVIQLTETDSLDHLEPAWSPDGSQIVYRVDDGMGEDLYLVDADGSNPRNLTRSGFGRNWQPEWLPDGSGIVFASDRDGDFDLYVIDLETGDIRRLTNEPGDELAPSWKPTS